MATRQRTREVFIELINLQLKPHSKTYEDVVNEQDWYMKYSTTRAKEQEFIQNATRILRTKLKMSKSVAEKEINWFILQWGLTTNSNQEETENVLIEKESKTTKRTKK